MLKDEEGAQIHFRGTKIIVKVSKEDSDGKYTMLEMVHPPNVGPALHISIRMLLKHTTYWKASIKSDVVKKLYHAQRGDFVFIPKGIEHKYQSGSNGGKVLVISSAGSKKYFIEIAETLSISPITWELEHEIACRYGQEFLESETLGAIGCRGI